MRIGLVYDLIDDYLAEGYSEEEAAEFDAPVTIDSIEAALIANGHKVERVGGLKKLIAALALGKRWDMVFNIAEGMYGLGREAQVPAILDAYCIPYTFSPTDVMVTTMNKATTKILVRQAGVPTPDFAVCSSAAEARAVKLPFPLFVKPVAEGTSKGVSETSRVTNTDELVAKVAEVNRMYKQPALVETFLPGREFTVGILGGGKRARVVGVMEITFKESGDQSCYSYRNKMGWHEIMTLVDDPTARAAGEMALKAWRALGCCDGGRIDVRVDAQGVPNFIEANPLAGLRPEYSELTILSEQAGLPYNALIGAIVEEAALRQKRRIPKRVRYEDRCPA